MRRLLLAAGLALTAWTACAQGLPPERQETLDKLLSIAAEGSKETARERVNSWLATLPKEQAGSAEMDLVQAAKDGGMISDSQFARDSVRITRQYVDETDPRRDYLLDFLTYRVMISTKLERKEISQEEWEHLLQRQQSELRRNLAEVAAGRQAAARQQAELEYRDRAAQAQAAAAAQAESALILGNMLGAIGRSIPRPAPTVNCYTNRIGSTLNTTCR